MNKRKNQKVKTRENILGAALCLYASNGIAATTTSDVAKMAKISHGTIFVHFQTKDSLIEEAISKFGDMVTMRLHELVDMKCGMKKILIAHLEALSEYEELYIKLITEVPLLEPSINHTLIGIQSNISFHISQAAKSEMKDGRIKEMPMHFLFNTWVGLIHYYLINKKLFSPNEKVISCYGNELVNHFMDLLYTGGGDDK